MLTPDQFENRIITGLKNSGLIKRFKLNQFTTTPSIDYIIKLFKNVSEIAVDKGGLYFIDEKGDKHYCPEMYTSIKMKGEWLSSKLPHVPFDIDCGGNVRMAAETRSYFLCTIVAWVIEESIFRDEIIAIAKNYDFKNMRPNDDAGKTFTQLQEEWQGLQSISVNVLFSAGKYKIQELKKSDEKFLHDGLTPIQDAEFKEVEAAVNKINYDYSKDQLSQEKMKLMSRIKRLQTIEEKDDKIKEAIASYKGGEVYALINLSTEYIDPIKKKKIQNWVRKSVDELLSQLPKNEDISSQRSQLLAKITRRAMLFERNSVRRENLDAYIKEGENFVFPSKQ